MIKVKPNLRQTNGLEDSHNICETSDSYLPEPSAEPTTLLRSAANRFYSTLSEQFTSRGEGKVHLSRELMALFQTHRSLRRK
jgi:hypothetical protein